MDAESGEESSESEPDSQTSGRIPGVWRLAGLMALLYAVQGSWWPLLAVHLHDLGVSDRGRGWIFGTLAIASLLVPLGAGQLVDRFWATQRYLAAVFVVAGLFLAIVASGVVTSGVDLFLIFLVYWLVSAPCYGVCNSLALRHLPRPQEQFAGVRLWGTVGWLLSGWVVTAVMAATGGTRAGHGAFEAFAVGAGFAFAVVVFCLRYVPHTPPIPTPLSEVQATKARDAWELVRDPAVGAYLVLALGVSMTSPFVFQVIPRYLETKGVPRAWVASAMTLGQFPEIAAIALLPWLLNRLGYRGVLALGVAAWSMRYGALAIDPPLWVVLASMPLHGIAVGCFTVGGQVFIDAYAPPHRRATAQAINVVVTGGLGALLGSLLAGEISQWCGPAFSTVFLVPCLVDLGLLCWLYGGFRPACPRMTRRVTPEASERVRIEDAAHPPTGSRARSVTIPSPPPRGRPEVVGIGVPRTESADG